MQTKNANISYQKNCKICGNNNLKNVLFINEQYISATFVKTNENNNLTKIKTPLTLVLCSENITPFLEMYTGEGHPLVH